MLRFGKISSIDAVKGLYRVTFQEDNLVTTPLPYLVKNSKFNKDESPFDIDEHVACLMDENCENGVILGATNTTSDAPDLGDADIRRTLYKDGTFIQYDRKNKKLTISCEGDVEVIKSKNVSVKSDTKITLECNDVEVKGNLKVTKDIISTTGDIKASVGDVKALTYSLSNHTHNVTAVGSPTGPTIP
jgi:phage baseplate assembly protein V